MKSVFIAILFPLAISADLSANQTQQQEAVVEPMVGEGRVGEQQLRKRGTSMHT